MSLPIVGKPRPSEPPTTKPLDLDRLMKLGVAVEDAAEDNGEDTASPDLLDELAEDLGVPLSHLYAAAAMTTDLVFSREHEVTFVVCAGGCQGWGALEHMETLLELRRDRQDDDKPLFNVHARNCLDKCADAPVVIVHTPAGMAVITKATGLSIRQAVEQACDG